MKLRSLWRKRKDVMEFNDKEKASAVKQQALQALHDENVRLGLYDGVYAVETLEQENRLLRARNERLEKRTWVGLTPEERSNCRYWACEDYETFGRAIEAKLKEKNT
jgi:hypothetical protein